MVQNLHSKCFFYLRIIGEDGKAQLGKKDQMDKFVHFYEQLEAKSWTEQSNHLY
jgi:hypothetical protein